MCIDYARLYVTATEFYENENDIPIDQDILYKIKKRILELNSKYTSLTDNEKQEIENIFLIVFFYSREDIWEECVFSDEISQIRNSLQN